MKCENHLCTPSLQNPGDPNFKHVCLAVSWVHAMELHPFFYTYPSSQLPSKKQRPTPNAFRTQLDGKMMCSLLTVDCTEKRTHKPKLEKSEMLRPSTQWSISSSVKKTHQHKDVSLVKQIQADSVLFCRSSKDFCRSALNLLPAWRADSLWPFKSFNCLGPMGQNPGVECRFAGIWSPSRILQAASCAAPSSQITSKVTGEVKHVMYWFELPFMLIDVDTWYNCVFCWHAWILFTSYSLCLQVTVYVTVYIM